MSTNYADCRFSAEKTDRQTNTHRHTHRQTHTDKHTREHTDQLTLSDIERYLGDSSRKRITTHMTRAGTHAASTTTLQP